MYFCTINDSGIMVVLSHLIYIKVEWKSKWGANIINRQQTMRCALNLKGYGFYIIHKSSDVLKSKCHKGHLKLFVVVFDTLIKLCEVTLILHFKRKRNCFQGGLQIYVCLISFPVTCHYTASTVYSTPSQTMVILYMLTLISLYGMS